MANFEKLQEIEEIEEKPEELTLGLLSNLISSYRLDHLSRLINDKDLICSPTEGNFETLCEGSRFVYGMDENLHSEEDSGIGMKQTRSDICVESNISERESVIDTNTTRSEYNGSVESDIFNNGNRSGNVMDEITDVTEEAENFIKGLSETDERKENFTDVEMIRESPDGVEEPPEKSYFEKESPKDESERGKNGESNENQSSEKESPRTTNSNEKESPGASEEDFEATKSNALKGEILKEDIPLASNTNPLIASSSAKVEVAEDTHLQPESTDEESIEATIRSLTTTNHRFFTTQQLVPINPSENHSSAPEWKRYFRLPLEHCSSFIPTPYAVQNHLKGSFNFLGNHGVGAWKTGMVSTDVLLNNLAR
uniref:Uncharacterized protein n=1 Tax=Clytia hemisphaerica TaxID=252671 RepID=A0A7M6DNB4_9CNID